MADNPVSSYLAKMKRTRVRFLDQVHVHEVPKVEIDLIPELFYSKFDYRRFKSEEKFREERAVARAIRRLVGHAVVEMDLRLGSCDDVQNMERELMSKSSEEANHEPAELVAISSDEESDYDEEEEVHVKPLAIREERVRARRRTSLIANQSFAYEEEHIGLETPCELAFDMPQANLADLNFDFGHTESIDLTFRPLDFETVLDQDSGRPSFVH